MHSEGCNLHHLSDDHTEFLEPSQLACNTQQFCWVGFCFGGGFCLLVWFSLEAEG